MNFKRKTMLLAMSFIMSVLLGLQDSTLISASSLLAASQSDTPPSTAPYFTPGKTTKMTPDNDGFIRRWLLLEPINKPNRTNTVFTDSYIREAFTTEYFPNQFSVLPKDGDKVTVGEQELKWHALESNGYNVKLFRFASNLEKEIYGVLFWAVTVIESPVEMKNIRMSVGSNSASMWWLNEEEVLILSGDRRMVMDNCVSTRLTLNKGKNIVRGAIINGPGMSDFCIRFLDENGEPIKNLTISYK
ncbi:MAG TPA: acetylxylan esterase [Bacteroidaceae bacterium]|nr:acetylxylan esterase [Bacteroidaceae bacterium]